MANVLLFGKCEQVGFKENMFLEEAVVRAGRRSPNLVVYTRHNIYTRLTPLPVPLPSTVVYAVMAAAAVVATCVLINNNCSGLRGGRTRARWTHTHIYGLLLRSPPLCQPHIIIIINRCCIQCAYSNISNISIYRIIYLLLILYFCLFPRFPIILGALSFAKVAESKMFFFFLKPKMLILLFSKTDNIYYTRYVYGIFCGADQLP